MTTYYQYIGIPKKGRNPSYQRFKTQHLPFPWDKIANIQEIDEDEMEMQTMGSSIEDQPLNPGDWMERIQKMQGGEIAKLKDLEKKG